MAASRRTRPGGRHDSRTPHHSGHERSANAEMAEGVSAALKEVVASHALFLEGVKIGRGGKNLVVKVVVDLPSGPGGVDSDRLTEVSRSISERLDDVDLVQGAYTLEVSTPGAERSLRDPRHFSRAQGRLVELQVVGGRSVSGRLVSVNGDTLKVQVEGGQRSVPMAEVVSGRVKIDMNRAAQAPIEEEED